MQQQISEEIRLEGKLKAHIIKQIFKDLGPKNLKGVQFFYLILRKDEMEMQFTSNAKDIFISILLKRSLFQNYLYSRENPSLHKYALDDFVGIAFMFENNKLVLDLTIEPAGFSVKSYTGKGFTEFVAIPMSCNQDDEDFVFEEKDLRPNQNMCMELKLAKVGLFEGILSYCRSCKLDNLWFRFESCKKMLEVTDKAEGHEIRWLLKVDDCRLYNIDRHMQFDCKTLNCALNLLPNDSELILTFYNNFVLLDVPEKEKTFTIRLNAKSRQ